MIRKLTGVAILLTTVCSATYQSLGINRTSLGISMFNYFDINGDGLIEFSEMSEA